MDRTPFTLHPSRPKVPYAKGDELICHKSLAPDHLTEGRSYTVVADHRGHLGVFTNKGAFWDNTGSVFTKAKPQVSLASIADMMKTEAIPATTKITLVGKDINAGGGALYSAMWDGEYHMMQLVVGARFSNRESAWFTHETLGELIEKLTAIRSLMKK